MTEDDAIIREYYSSPAPTSAVRTDKGECSYDDCENGAEYLVKAEAQDGATAKTRVCQQCSDENRIWAERYLPETGVQNE